MRCCADDDKGTVTRKRAVLRLLLELLLCGLFSAHQALLGIVKQLAAVDFAKDPEGGQAALSLLTAFAKAGREEVLGLPPGLPVHLAARPVQQQQQDGSASGEVLEAAIERYTQAVQAYQSELQQRYSLLPDVQRQFLAAVSRSFEAACVALKASHAALQQTEQDNARVLNNRGDLPEDMAAAYEAQRKGFEGLQRTTAALAEVLDRQLPELVDSTTRIAASAAAEAGAASKEAEQPQQVFEDEETRAFYQSLPDLRAVVPAMLLGDGRGKEEGGESEPAGPSKAPVGSSQAEPSQQQPQQQQGGLHPSGSSTSLGSGGAKASAGGLDEPLDGKPPPEEGPREPSQLELLLSRLPTAVSKELSDELAVNFCYTQNKGARRCLARALCDVPFGSLQVLPYYSRMAATLSQVFPDIAQGEEEVVAATRRAGCCGLEQSAF